MTKNPAERFIPILKNPIFWAFALPFLYWTYLFFSTTMDIEHDAFTYKELALGIYKGGWPGFFQNEPKNVPLYPLIISLSMRIADLLSISYLKVQTCIQILILFASQVLLYKILTLLRIQRNVVAAVIFYFGFSPAIVNSAFSLFCEIITYPLILALLLTFVSAWQHVLKNQSRKIFISSLFLVILFVLLALVRPIFEYVLILFVLVFLCFSFYFSIKRQWKKSINILLLILTTFFVFRFALIPYRQMNYKYNGYRSLVSTGSFSVYGNTVTRTEKLTTREALTFLANIPGDNVCQKIFNKEECSSWLFYKKISSNKIKELQAQGMSNNQIDSMLYKLSLKNIYRNPFQYAFLTIAEGAKMFFGESTQLSYVTYPPWLSKIFDFLPFKNGIRLFAFLLTIFSTFYVARYLWKNKRKLFGINQNENNEMLFLFFILALILINIILHAPFYILVRYALPIAPLYLLAIAFTFQKLIFKTRQED